MKPKCALQSDGLAAAGSCQVRSSVYLGGVFTLFIVWASLSWCFTHYPGISKPKVYTAISSVHRITLKCLKRFLVGYTQTTGRKQFSARSKCSAWLLISHSRYRMFLRSRKSPMSGYWKLSQDLRGTTCPDNPCCTVGATRFFWKLEGNYFVNQEFNVKLYFGLHFKGFKRHTASYICFPLIA